MNKPQIGDIVEYQGKPHRVISVWPKFTPYRKPNQDIRVEGWGVGLKEIRASLDTDPWC